MKRNTIGVALIVASLVGMIYAEDPPSNPTKSVDLDSAVESVKGNTIQEANLTTEGLQSGNWVEKRKYWEEAGAVFGGIRAVAAEMRKKQSAYVEAQNASDKKVEAAFVKLGFEQGELSQLLESLVKSMERERTERGDLDVDEREFLAKLKEKQKILEALRKDLTTIATIDATVQKTVATFTEQLAKAGTLEDSAWSDYQKIGKVLSHEEAHNLYYTIHGTLENLHKLDQYVTHTLWQSMQENLAKIDAQLAKVTVGIDALKAQGVDFVKELVEFRKTDEEREAERRAYEEEQERMAQEAAARKKKKKDTGWWQMLMSYMPWS